MIRYIYNDGGREAAGFKGSASDCVARSIAIVSGRPYAIVYGELAEINARMPKTQNRVLSGWTGGVTADRGIYTTSKLFKDYMLRLGFVWTPTMKVGEGCRVHLRADELPKGKIVVKLSKHYAAVVNSVLHDTSNCSRRGTRCVYGIWSLKEDL